MAKDYNYYGNWIRTHRKRRNMTQVELAKEVGVSWNSIGLYERGEVCPPVDLFEMLVGVLGGEIIVKERYGFEYEADYE